MLSNLQNMWKLSLNSQTLLDETEIIVAQAEARKLWHYKSMHHSDEDQSDAGRVSHC